jgi:hypothetical protein
VERTVEDFAKLCERLADLLTNPMRDVDEFEAVFRLNREIDFERL